MLRQQIFYEQMSAVLPRTLSNIDDPLALDLVWNVALQEGTERYPDCMVLAVGHQSQAFSLFTFCLSR